MASQEQIQVPTAEGQVPPGHDLPSCPRCTRCGSSQATLLSTRLYFRPSPPAGIAAGSPSSGCLGCFSKSGAETERHTAVWAVRSPYKVRRTPGLLMRGSEGFLLMFPCSAPCTGLGVTAAVVSKRAFHIAVGSVVLVVASCLLVCTPTLEVPQACCEQAGL